MAKITYLTLVERHLIKKDNPLFTIFDDLLFKAKNLYNFSNYIQRQLFFTTGTVNSFNKLNTNARDRVDNQDYRALPAWTSNCVVKTLSDNWSSFFKAIKKYRKNPSKFTGKPCIPGYLPKNGRFTVTFSNQQCKIVDGVVKFPEALNGIKVKTKVDQGLQQVRLVSRGSSIILEVVYRKEIPDKSSISEESLISLDLGLDNFATIINTKDLKNPLVLNGKGLKSYNKRYNKRLAHFRSVAKRMNCLDFTNRMRTLTDKRNRYMDNFMHQASSYVIKLAEEHEISSIIIGYNKDWKRNSKLSKVVNQFFIQIPYKRFIDQIVYKAQLRGINVLITEESYTSGTSFVDNEFPTKKCYNKSRRITRGLFKSDNGTLINADVNAAYQIVKKVFPNLALAKDGIVGVGLHPVRVNVV